MIKAIKNLLTSLRDVNFPKVVGNDGKAVGYNHTSRNFEPLSTGSNVTVDTRDNILSLSPSDNSSAFASDTLELAVWDGSGWYFSPLELDNISSNSPNIGVGHPLKNDRSGISAEYLTDKSIHNSQILSNVVESSGSIRTIDGNFEIYLEGTWQKILTNFRLREDSTNKHELEHKPIGLTFWYEIMSGNTQDNLGLNGLPLGQQYIFSMGAYPAALKISSREITT